MNLEETNEFREDVRKRRAARMEMSEMPNVEGEKINAGFGEELPMRPPGWRELNREASKETLARLAAKTEADIAAVREEAAQAEGGAHVAPVGKQAAGLAKGGGGSVGRIYNMIAGGMIKSDVGSNLPVLQYRLIDEFGWKASAGKVGRLESPNGVAVDMGYTLGEVWWRAYAPTMGSTAPAQPIAAGRMLKWDDDDYKVGSAVALRELLHMDIAFHLPALVDIGDKPALPTGFKLSPRGVALPKPLAFQQLSEHAILPTRSYDGDAGFDLYCDCIDDEFFDDDYVVVKPGKFTDIPVGVAVGLPTGYWARLIGRSSTMRRRGLLVAEGIIDNGYIGPLYVGVWNLTDTAVKVTHGERIAQLILHTNDNAAFEPTWATGPLRSTARGSNGMGSSGN